MTLIGKNVIIYTRHL